jgi:hypothetical protein
MMLRKRLKNRNRVIATSGPTELSEIYPKLSSPKQTGLGPIKPDFLEELGPVYGGPQ